MSIGPRVVFTRFSSASSPKLGPWRDHAARVMGHTPEMVEPTLESRYASMPDREPESPGESAIVWHLVSANNRMLARSAQIFRRFDDAVDRAERTVAAAALLEVSYVGDESRGMHGWLAVSGGTTVMTCARWYLSDRDRRHSIDLAVTSIGLAMLRPGARLIDPAILQGGVVRGSI